MKRPPNCCHLPTLTLFCNGATEDLWVELEICSCWGAPEFDPIIWTGHGEDDVLAGAEVVVKWTESRGARVMGFPADIDRAEERADAGLDWEIVVRALPR